MHGGDGEGRRTAKCAAQARGGRVAGRKRGAGGDGARGGGAGRDETGLNLLAHAPEPG